MPTLAELRAARPAHRAERAFTICLSPHVVAEVEALSEELERLTLEAVTGGSGDAEDGPPRKMGESTRNERADEVRDRLADLLEKMSEDEGELRVRAVDDGTWRRWVSAHPARDKEQDPAGFARDFEIAGGYCNADDLIDDLAVWAFTWDGEPLSEGDWAVLSATIARPDKKQIARGVVAMHEQMGFELPKWRAGLSATLKRSPSGGSRAPSADPPVSSSAESPQSDASTTTPTTS